MGPMAGDTQPLLAPGLIGASMAPSLLGAFLSALLVI